MRVFRKVVAWFLTEPDDDCAPIETAFDGLTVIIGANLMIKLLFLIPGASISPNAGALDSNTIIFKISLGMGLVFGFLRWAVLAECKRFGFYLGLCLCISMALGASVGMILASHPVANIFITATAFLLLAWGEKHVLKHMHRSWSSY